MVFGSVGGERKTKAGVSGERKTRAGGLGKFQGKHEKNTKSMTVLGVDTSGVRLKATFQKVITKLRHRSGSSSEDEDLQPKSKKQKTGRMASPQAQIYEPPVPDELEGDTLDDQRASQTKTQTAYLEEFMQKHRDRFAAAIMKRQARRGERECIVCGLKDSAWRCLSCIGQPSFCRDHCREAHRLDPFHRVATWNGTHYTPDWLWAAGVRIFLGHNGEPCPDAVDTVNDEGLEDVAQDGPDARPSDFRNHHRNAETSRSTLNGHTVVAIVHTNAVHQLPVVKCACPGREDCVLDDYLEVGLFPSSFQLVKTAFTFEMLEDSMLDFLECHTTPSSYYEKLRRHTNPVHPESVPTRILEMHRTKRCWLHISELMEHGFAHTGKPPGEGELTYFCARCPQPGVNLPTDYKNDTNQYKFMRGVAGDGDFVLVHQASRKPENDVKIKTDEGFLANAQKFATYEDDVKNRKIAKASHTFSSFS